MRLLFTASRLVELCLKSAGLSSPWHGQAASTQSSLCSGYRGVLRNDQKLSQKYAALKIHLLSRGCANVVLCQTCTSMDMSALTSLQWCMWLVLFVWADVWGLRDLGNLIHSVILSCSSQLFWLDFHLPEVGRWTQTHDSQTTLLTNSKTFCWSLDRNQWDSCTVGLHLICLFSCSLYIH